MTVFKQLMLNSMKSHFMLLPMSSTYIAGINIHSLKTFTVFVFQRLKAAHDLNTMNSIKGVSFRDAKRLGKGAYGDVYRVSYRGCPVALKVQYTSATALTEVHNMLRVKKHPNILP